MTQSTAGQAHAATAAAYLQNLAGIITSRTDEAAGEIAAAARLIGESIVNGGILHLFGSGHSRLVAIDTAVRASSLTCSTVIVPEDWPGRVERTEGLGEAVLRRSDIRSGEVLVVISNSGVNPLPLDVAGVAAGRGASIVGVGSAAHSKSMTSRHSSGRKLMDVSDVFLDTGVPAGDSILQPEGIPPIGPASTVAASVLVHAVLVETIGWLAAHGHEPPVRRSRNLPGGDEHNARVAAPYLDRIPELRWM